MQHYLISSHDMCIFYVSSDSYQHIGRSLGWCWKCKCVDGRETENVNCEGRNEYMRTFSHSSVPFKTDSPNLFTKESIHTIVCRNNYSTSESIFNSNHAKFPTRLSIRSWHQSRWRVGWLRLHLGEEWPFEFFDRVHQKRALSTAQLLVDAPSSIPYHWTAQAAAKLGCCHSIVKSCTIIETTYRRCWSAVNNIECIYHHRYIHLSYHRYKCPSVLLTPSHRHRQTHRLNKLYHHIISYYAQHIRRHIIIVNQEWSINHEWHEPT